MSGGYIQWLGAACLAVMLSGPAVAEKPTIVDGNTIKVDGKRMRLRNHDAPETSASRGSHAPKCERERQLGEAAKARLQEIVKNGTDVKVSDPVAIDKYRRPVVIMTVDGKDPGKQLIAEGLAKRRKADWCQ